MGGMTDDLFPELPPVLSPRLKWMQEHGVQTRETPEHHLRWEAWIGEYPETPDEVITASVQCRIIAADSEKEAIAGIAELNGWKLWNEV